MPNHSSTTPIPTSSRQAPIDIERPPVMDLRRLRHFVVLADTLNFRRAAERLNMAQPPLTVSIQKLETELGLRLFERGTSGVRLTAGGQAVLVEARKLLLQSVQLGAVARHALDGSGGTLHIGFVGTSTWGMLQQVIPRFRATHPGVELVLHEATSVNVLQRLEEHSLDVGFVRTPVFRTTACTLTPLQKDVFVAALPRGHALDAQAYLKLSDLAHEPFVMYAEHSATGLHGAAMLACQAAGFIPRVAQEGVQVQTVLALVESGLGVALVPSLMQRYTSERICYRPLLDLSAAADIGLALAHLPTVENPAAQRLLATALHVSSN